MNVSRADWSPPVKMTHSKPNIHQTLFTLTCSISTVSQAGETFQGDTPGFETEIHSGIVVETVCLSLPETPLHLDCQVVGSSRVARWEDES